MGIRNGAAPTRQRRGGKVLHFIQWSFYRLPIILQSVGIAVGALAMVGAAFLLFCLLLGVPGGGQ